MTGPTDDHSVDEDPAPDEAAPDEVTTEPAVEEATPADQTRRPPATAAAAAASRARRIGGRSVTARSADASTAASVAAAPATDSVTPEDDAPPRSKRTRGKAATPAVGLTKGSDQAEAKTRKFSRTRKSADPAPSGSGGSRPGLRWIPAVVLTVAALVLAVVVAVSTHGERWDRPSGGSVRDQVLATAKSCLVTTNTYKYTAIDAYEKKGLACAGGTFATQFRSTVEKVLRKNAAAVKQQQSLQVNTAGLIDVTDNNQWDVLVYGQISVTNTSQTTARLDPFGAVAHLKKIDGKWRVTQLCSQSVGGTADACY